MAAARVDESSKITCAAYMRLQFVAVQQPRRAVAVFLVQLARPIVEFLQVPRLDGDVDMIRAIVAIDGVLADQRLGKIQRLDGQVEQAACVVAADLGDERLLTRRQAENGLPAAAAGGPVADDVGLEQGDPVATFRQMQCRRTAGDAAAEHRHIASDVRRATSRDRAPLSQVADVAMRRRSRKGRAGRTGARRLFKRKCLKFCGY